MKNKSTKMIDEFLKLSYDYLKAYEVVEKKWPDNIELNHFQMSKVKWYLLGLTLELSLKTFLYSCGFTTKKLKALGHDLSACHREAENNKLFNKMKYSQKGALIAQLRVFSKNYNKQFFKYPDIHNQNPISFTPPQTLYLTIKNVLCEIEKNIESNNMKAEST